MAGYWSRAPFISYDGPDSNDVRAEVKVTLGYAVPTQVEPSGAGKAARVTFPVDNTKWPSSGWAPVDSEVLKLVNEANENETPLFFRIETVRKKGVDRSASIEELTAGSDKARENANKSLAAVKREGDENWTINPHAMTRIEEDPNEEGGTSAYAHSLESLKNAKGGATSSEGAVAAVAVEPLTIDDSPNYRSAALLHGARLFAYLVNYTNERGIEADSNKLREVSRVILTVATRLQTALDHELEQPDLTVASFENALEATKLTLETLVPLEEETLQSSEGLSSWFGALTKSTHALWKWSAGEANRFA